MRSFVGVSAETVTLTVDAGSAITSVAPHPRSVNAPVNCWPRLSEVTVARSGSAEAGGGACSFAAADLPPVAATEAPSAMADAARTRTRTTHRGGRRSRSGIASPFVCSPPSRQSSRGWSRRRRRPRPISPDAGALWVLLPNLASLHVHGARARVVALAGLRDRVRRVGGD